MILKLKLKLYLLRCSTTLYDYQQKVDAQLDANSDSDTDSDNNYIQCDLSTSLLDHWTHDCEKNNEYTDLNNAWCALILFQLWECDVLKEKKWDMLSLFL